MKTAIGKPCRSPNDFVRRVRSPIRNGVSGDLQRVDLSLGLASGATLSLDAVEAVSQIAMGIVVNSTGDLPNRDPDGCCCDAGGLLNSVGLEGFFELRFDGREGGPVTLHRNGEVGEHVRMDGGEVELLGRIAIQMEEQRWVVRDRRVGAIG